MQNTPNKLNCSRLVEFIYLASGRELRMASKWPKGEAFVLVGALLIW